MRVIRWLLWKLYYRHKYRKEIRDAPVSEKWRRAVSGVTKERWEAALRAQGHRVREDTER